MINEQQELAAKAAAFDLRNRKENINLLKQRFCRLAGAIGFVVGLAVARLFGAPVGWQIVAGIVVAVMAYFGCEGLNEDRLSRHDNDTLENLAVAYVRKKDRYALIWWIVVIIVVLFGLIDDRLHSG